MKKEELKVLRQIPDKRKDKEQALIWITEGFSGMRTERRECRDSKIATEQLFRMAQNSMLQGMLFVIIKSDGTIDIGATGLAYRSPVVASGAAARLQALMDAWEQHPGELLPVKY